MAYKYSRGPRKFDDITAEGDVQGNTKIDFEEDYIALMTSGSNVLVVSGSLVGISTATPDEALVINGVESGSDQTMIKFTEDGSDRALIGVNTSNNVLIENLFSNKHIVFKASDAGTAREGLRLDGAVPEVVVNQTSDSLVDFRVESNNDTHMLYVDGGEDKVGIGISSPAATLHVHSDSINDGAVRISQADDSTDASQLDLTKSRGTGASPSAVQGNDFIGQIRFVAWDGNSYDNFADMYVQATGSIDTTSHPSKIIIRTTKENQTSPSVALTIDENQNLDVAGNLSFPDIMMTELSIPGIDVATDTNAYRFNCPYNLTVTSLRLNLDQHSTSGDVTVTVTNSTTSTTMITLSITGTGLSANTTSVSSASAAAGDSITFAITATPADAQGLRAALGFRRDL